MTQCTSAASETGGAFAALCPLLSPGRAAEDGVMGVGTQGKGDYFSGKKWGLLLALRHLSRAAALAQRMMMGCAPQSPVPQQLSMGEDQGPP